MVNLIMATEMPAGFWQSIIGWFYGFVSSYGWTIILFTICLKLVLSPLDLWQKLSMRKTTKQQAILKPELAKIQEKYGHDKNLYNQKTMELYQQNHINPMAGCLGMIVNLVLTMVIFFTVFAAMNNVSQFKIGKEYETLKQTYIESYGNFTASGSTEVVEFEGNSYTFEGLKVYYTDAVEKPTKQDGTAFADEVEFANFGAEKYAQEVVETKFEEIKEGFLWIKNIFRPDNYSASFPGYSEFKSSSESLVKVKQDDIEGNYYYKDLTGTYYKTSEDATLDAENLAQAKEKAEQDYNIVTLKVRQDYGSWNGYFILIILAAGSTLLSQLLANAGIKAKNKKGEEVSASGQTNKILLVVMPLIMIWFTWGYSSAFAIYIIVNSIMSALIGYLINISLNSWDNHHEQKVIVSSKSSKTGKSNIANEDYRIEKKGKIIVENNEKKPKQEKKSKKTEDTKGQNN